MEESEFAGMDSRCENDAMEARAESPADLIAAAALVLGYHPADSLVVLALDGRTVGFLLRLDLPETTAQSEREDFSAAVLGILREHQVARAVVLGYGEAEAVTPILEEVCSAMAGSGIGVVAALRVAAGRYFPYPARSGDDAGTPFDVATSSVTAHAVLAGMVTLPDREALAATIEPIAGAEREKMLDATAEAMVRLATLVAYAGTAAAVRTGHQVVANAVRRYRAAGTLSMTEMAELIVHLISPDVRDRAGCAITGEDWELAMWRDVTRHADRALVASPAALLAFTAWRRGEGALAGLAVERALNADPSCRLAQLMAQALTSGACGREFPASGR